MYISNYELAINQSQPIKSVTVHSSILSARPHYTPKSEVADLVPPTHRIRKVLTFLAWPRPWLPFRASCAVKWVWAYMHVKCVTLYSEMDMHYL